MVQIDISNELPAACLLFGKYVSHLKQLDANWQIASYRTKVYKSCNCIMFRVRLPACWDFFFMYGESK